MTNVSICIVAMATCQGVFAQKSLDVKVAVYFLEIVGKQHETGSESLS